MTWEEHCKAVAAGKPGFQIVEVVWEDAAAFGIEWTEKCETELRLTTTVGYLVHEDTTAISVVSMINTSHLGHGVVIPVYGIISWRVLE